MSAFLTAMRESATRDELLEALAEKIAERDALRAQLAEATRELEAWKASFRNWTDGGVRYVDRALAQKEEGNERA